MYEYPSSGARAWTFFRTGYALLADARAKSKQRCQGLAFFSDLFHILYNYFYYNYYNLFYTFPITYK